MNKKPEESDTKDFNPHNYHPTAISANTAEHHKHEVIEQKEMDEGPFKSFTIEDMKKQLDAEKAVTAAKKN